MDIDGTTRIASSGNISALLANLKKDSLAHKLVEVASNAQPQERQAAIAAALQARVKVLSRAFAHAKDQMD